MRHIIVILIVLTVPVIASAATLNVPSQYPTIQDAIDASMNGDTVLVAPGTYVENIDFKGKAITVKSESGSQVTFIDGGSPVNPDFGSVALFQSGEGLDSVLEGFTITNGIGTRDPYWGTIIGGGIYCDGSSPTIRHNTITGNTGDEGAGIGAWYGASPIIYKNLIMNNSADGYDGGGGICVYENSHATISQNTIIYNNAKKRAGGIVVVEKCNVLITENVIAYNSAFQENGGGIYCRHNGVYATIQNNIIANNLTGSLGGGIYLDQTIATLINNTVTENSAGANGGGMYFTGNGTKKVINTIVWKNTAPSNPAIRGTTSTFVTFSDISGGYPGTGNINSDPLFVDQVNGDFHLTFNSPCKDTGDNNAVTELYDFEGDPRIAYGTVDMGADEFYTHLYWTGDATPGGNVEIKFVGLPGTAPVGLCIGTGVLDPPLKSMWGDWYLQFPIIGPLDLGKIPSPDGILVVPGIIPGSPPPPYSIPMQALIGGELTNLSVLEVH